ncbi:unnamed protein product, partial [Tetraodon nigroviridis]
MEINTSSQHALLWDALRADVMENPLQPGFRHILKFIYGGEGMYLLGIIISVCGNVLISISLNIQKYTHLRQAERGSKPYYTSGVWWFGVILMGVGELGNFAAYGFAPATLIAPLGCVSVIVRDVSRGATAREQQLMSARVTPTFPGQPTPCTSPFRSNGVALGAVLLSESKDEEMKGRQASLGGGTECCFFSLSPASAIISVVFLKETVRASDILGGTLAITGTYLLVTFAPHNSVHITAHLVQYYMLCWQFLLYLFIEVVVFCVLLYLYTRRNVKHIVVVMLLVALLASLTVISVKAVSGMITETIKGQLQFIYPIFYVMLVVMFASCGFQIKFLNEAMKMFDATEVVPINFVFFTASAIIAGVVFYQEFQGLALLNIFMFLFGCLLSFLGVFLIARNRPK